jgi:NADPH:quinone reductase-like Zn-dependent oxidoreductase
LFQEKEESPVTSSIALRSEPSSADESTKLDNHTAPAAAAERETMKAVLHTRYGRPDLLEFGEAATPVIEDDQVLVRVHAASVNPVEWYGVTGPYFARIGNGFRKPNSTAVGADLAGRVAAVGKNVDELRPGDEVFGTGVGGWAEYAVARPAKLARKPANVSFEDAAALPVAAITALQALRDKGQVQAGQKVLINGASGGVGTYAVQLAKSFGAEVTAVCSTGNVDTARSLGADRVIDYTKEDFTKSGERYDLMLDIAGSRSFFAFRRVLKSDATVVLIGGKMKYRGLGPLPHLAGTFLKSRGRSQNVTFFIAKINTEDLAFLGKLLETGEVKSVIDRRYELCDAADALAYLGEGHARGKIVITV